MANIDDGFRVEILSLDGISLLAAGINAPNSGIGYNAPQGSLYLKYDAGTNGELYLKQGPNDVDWILVNHNQGNITYVSDIEPTSVNDGDGWYNPTTTLLQIYNNLAFEPVKVNEAENINDGYF